MMRFNSLIFILVLFFIGYIPEAHAYIDPGTGSAIVQGVLGALAALVLTVRLWWHRLLVLLGIRKRISKPAESGNDVRESSQP